MTPQAFCAELLRRPPRPPRVPIRRLSRRRVPIVCTRSSLRSSRGGPARNCCSASQALVKGGELVLEYHAYNYENPKPVPIINRLFMRRHPGVDPMTSLIDPKSGARFGSTIDGWPRNPAAKDPSVDVGTVDCAELVRHVPVDAKVNWKASGSGPPKDNVVGASDDWIGVHATGVGDLAPGDLLISASHIAIFVGDGSIVHAPHPGRAVSKDKLSDLKSYTSFRRYQPRGTATKAPPTAAP
jgi:hypothetical protein